MSKLPLFWGGSLAVLAAFPLFGDGINYKINFTVDAPSYQHENSVPVEELVVPTGSFTYDPQTDVFTDFIVDLGPYHFDFTSSVVFSPLQEIQDSPCAGAVSPVFALLSKTLPESCSAPRSLLPYETELTPPPQDYFWDLWYDHPWFWFGAGPGGFSDERGGNIRGNLILPSSTEYPPYHSDVHQPPPEYGTYSIAQVPMPEPQTIPLLLLDALWIALAVGAWRLLAPLKKSRRTLA